MDIKELGEFGLIDMIREDTIFDETGVVLGIGDDAAAYAPSRGKLQLVATDMLVEGVHFDLRFTPPFELGYKALAVNLSDIAAMGGAPRQAVVAIAIPGRLDARFIAEFYRGMKALGRAHGVNIVGGDTAASPNGFVVNVTALGEVAPKHMLRRGGAKAGELVAVTGDLGDSSAGLLCLQRGETEAAFAKKLIQAHIMPRPRVEAGLALAPFAASADDISDGLSSEAMEIASASRVGLRLWAEKIPLSAELLAAARHFGKPALDFALYGGEDYQLLFTIAEDRYEALLARFPDTRFTVIGQTTDRENSVELVGADGEIVKLAPKGYNHFR